MGLSITDGLTGLHNRRHLNAVQPDEIARAHRYGHSISVVICDIDHFKRINNSDGNPGGDAVLQRLARLMATQVRVGIDCVARYGGEEFALVLPQADLTQAMSVAERLRTAIESLVVDFNGRIIHLTSSFGVAVAAGRQRESVTADELLLRADLGLYRSKLTGRIGVSAEESSF
jgi:diguanylate cyclase (GGDEF)-like protein